MEDKHYCDLLIVGNGFDLNCGYKTSYKDFLVETSKRGISFVSKNFWFSLFRCAQRNNYLNDNDWCSIEACILQVINFVQYLKTLSVEKNPMPGIDGYGNNLYSFYIPLGKFGLLNEEYKKMIFLDECLPKSKIIFVKENEIGACSNKNFLKPDDEIGIKFFYTFYHNEFFSKNLFDKIINDLSSQLDEVENLLKEYIYAETKNKKEHTSSSYVSKQLFAKYSFEKVLNFNYSKTLELHFGFADEQVFHVHGSTSTDSEVVLGTEDVLLDGNQLHTYFVFCKRWRRFHKNTNSSFNEEIIKCLQNESEIVLFGLSLDKTDYSILYEIFNKKCKRYTIYFFPEKSEQKSKYECEVKLADLIGLDLLDELNKSGKIQLIPII